MKKNISTSLLMSLLLVGLSSSVTARNLKPDLDSIRRLAPQQGGLMILVGNQGPKLLVELVRDTTMTARALLPSARDVEKARILIKNQGLYGRIAVEHWPHDYLPFIDNLVNILIVTEPKRFKESEITRVLRPLGVALLSNKEGTEKWRKIVKPWPDNIDEWTHYLHDPGNNAVAHDTAIGPLRHLQWEAAPRYSRHHEYTSSVAAVVSARGRIFTIMDMGSRASIHMPSKWRLTARDAYNGINLWERPIDSWFNHLWPLKNGPAQPPRRLVAIGDDVYVTLGLEAGVSRLDAATGQIRKTYPDTEFTEEILCLENTLFLLKHNQSMNPKDYYPKLMVCWDEKKRTLQESEGYLLKPENRDIVALDLETDRELWKVQHPVEPLTLAVDADNVYFHNWERVVCLDRRTGTQRWQSPPAAPRKTMGLVYGPILVAYQDVVLFADGRQKRRIYAFDKQDGRLLWEAPHYPAGHAGSAEDLLVVDGLVWCGKIAGGKHDGVFTGRDPRTGEVKREFTPQVDTYWFHHRCYRAKATDEYILTSRTGIEFVDIKAQTWETNHWVRGACTYGIVPCNGMVYAPPHPCACYLDAKLSGFCALAPARPNSEDGRRKTENRWQRGPAFGQIRNPQSTIRNEHDWPMYRHDAKRSGSTTTTVQTPQRAAWQAKLGGTLTSPVVADKRVYVATQEDHTLHALEAGSGTKIWSFITKGRIDSPPTLDGDRVLFGCTDGYVYCLRADDGALAWSFRAAPQDQRLVSYGHVESVWPVHGSVLVQGNVVSCVAGRSTFLDGGLRFLQLDASTGRLLSERVFNDRQNPQQDVKVLNMPVALPDVLSSDGEFIYMRSQVFDMQGNRVQTVDPGQDPFDRATDQLGRGSHLFCPTGFLDDDAWHRSYWIYGRAFSSGCNWWYRAGRYAPAGRLLVYDDDRVYGFGREPGLFVWSHVLENHLFCSSHQASPQDIERVKAWSKESGRDAIFNRRFTRFASVEKRLAPEQHWSISKPPFHARAMVLAGDTLFVAGPPDVLDEDQAFNNPQDPKTRKHIKDQEAAYAGKRGALLLGYSKIKGDQSCRLDIPAPPVWDGMIAAQGRLFISLRDGSLICLDR